MSNSTANFSKPATAPMETKNTIVADHKFEGDSTKALNHCLDWTQKLCQQYANFSFNVIDTMASRLTGIDVTELMNRDKKVYEAHYETKFVDDENSELLGWRGYCYLPLLIRNYFHILFYLKQKDFSKLSNDAYGMSFTLDGNLYNQTVAMVENETIIALNCLNLARAMGVVNGITDTDERLKAGEKLAEQMVNLIKGLKVNGILKLYVGWKGHAFYITLQKLVNTETNDIEIHVVSHNNGSGRSAIYPDHLPHGGSCHHLSLKEKGKKLIAPRKIGIISLKDTERLQSYIHGVIRSFKDKSRDFVLAKIYDYFQHLNIPNSQGDYKFNESQRSGNCVTYNSVTEQKARLSLKAFSWLQENELNLVKSFSLSEDGSRILHLLSPFKYENPMLDFLQHLLRMVSGSKVKLLDSVQLQKVFDLLQKKDLLLSELNGWTKRINGFVTHLRVLDQIEFEKCGLTDLHIGFLIDILVHLPQVKRIYFNNVTISEASVMKLLAFVQQPNCHVRSIFFGKNRPACVNELDKALRLKRYQQQKENNVSEAKKLTGQKHVPDDLEENPKSAKRAKIEENPKSAKRAKTQGLKA